MDNAPHIPRKVVLLAGGVGGARMAEGLAGVLPAGTLTVIGNVGDDESFYGLHVSPDIDTLLYTLSDRIDRSRGWGLADDSTQALSVLAELGAPDWMILGDKDLGLHIWRSWRMAQGATLTEVTAEACRRFRAGAQIIPATDDRVRTQLRTETGWMDFQNWFVREKCGPTVLEIRYAGIETARPTAAALAAIGDADTIIFAPSNPLLSIHPILALPGMRRALHASGAPRIAVSPMIGGKAIKGPLGQLIRQLGYAEGTRFVIDAYAGLIDGLVIDSVDAADAAHRLRTDPRILATDILISNPAAARTLASRMLAWLPVLDQRIKREA